jgi:hypothetical protein
VILAVIATALLAFHFGQQHGANQKPAGQGNLAADASRQPTTSQREPLATAPLTQQPHVPAAGNADIPALRAKLDQRLENLQADIPVINAHLAKARELGNAAAAGDKPVAALAKSYPANPEAARALVELAPQFTKALAARRGDNP